MGADGIKMLISTYMHEKKSSNFYSKDMLRYLFIFDLCFEQKDPM